MVYADGNPDAPFAGGGASGVDVIKLIYSLQDSVAPIITEPPHPIAVIEGNAAAFSVSSVGANPIHYQWFFNGEALDEQTSASMRIPVVSTASGGHYHATISNGAGNTNTPDAVLLVVPSPEATQIIPPENASLEGDGVSAVLSLPLRQQEIYSSSMFVEEPILITQLRYRLDGASATRSGGVGVFLSNSIVRLSTTLKQPGGLDLKFEDNYGADVVEVFHGDWLVSGRSASSVLVSPNSFDIILQLASPFLYDPGVGNLLVETVVNDHSPFLITQDVVAAGGRTQRIFIQDPNSSVAAIGDSSAAVMLVGYSPAKISPRIFSQPTSLTVLEGNSAELSVTASGGKPLSYHWSFNGMGIPDATQGVLHLEHAYLANSGVYSVIVSNEFGFVTSTEARLTITPLPTEVAIGSVSAASGQHFSVPVILHSRGNENGISFGLRFTSPLLILEGLDLTGLAEDPIVNINTNSADVGSVGLALILSNGRTFSPGTNALVLLRFRAAPSLSNPHPQSLC